MGKDVEERNMRQTHEDVLRQARITHRTTMSNHLSMNVLALPKPSLLRVQYDDSPSMPIELQRLEAIRKSAKPPRTLPKCITVKATPRFGSIALNLNGLSGQNALPATPSPTIHVPVSSPPNAAGSTVASAGVNEIEPKGESSGDASGGEKQRDTMIGGDALVTIGDVIAAAAAEDDPAASVSHGTHASQETWPALTRPALRSPAGSAVLDLLRWPTGRRSSGGGSGANVFVSTRKPPAASSSTAIRRWQMLKSDLHANAAVFAAAAECNRQTQSNNTDPNYSPLVYLGRSAPENATLGTSGTVPVQSNTNPRASSLLSAAVAVGASGVNGRISDSSGKYVRRGSNGGGVSLVPGLGPPQHPATGTRSECGALSERMHGRFRVPFLRSPSPGDNGGDGDGDCGKDVALLAPSSSDFFPQDLASSPARPLLCADASSTLTGSGAVTRGGQGAAGGGVHTVSLVSPVGSPVAPYTSMSKRPAYGTSAVLRLAQLCTLPASPGPQSPASTSGLQSPVLLSPAASGPPSVRRMGPPSPPLAVLPAGGGINSSSSAPAPAVGSRIVAASSNPSMGSSWPMSTSSSEGLRPSAWPSPNSPMGHPPSSAPRSALLSSGPPSPGGFRFHGRDRACGVSESGGCCIPAASGGPAVSGVSSCSVPNSPAASLLTKISRVQPKQPPPQEWTSELEVVRMPHSFTTDDGTVMMSPMSGGGGAGSMSGSVGNMGMAGNGFWHGYSTMIGGSMVRRSAPQPSVASRAVAVRPSRVSDGEAVVGPGVATDMECLEGCVQQDASSLSRASSNDPSSSVQLPTPATTPTASRRLPSLTIPSGPEGGSSIELSPACPAGSLRASASPENCPLPPSSPSPSVIAAAVGSPGVSRQTAMQAPPAATPHRACWGANSSMRESTMIQPLSSQTLTVASPDFHQPPQTPNLRLPPPSPSQPHLPSQQQPLFTPQHSPKLQLAPTPPPQQPRGHSSNSPRPQHHPVFGGALRAARASDGASTLSGPAASGAAGMPITTSSSGCSTGPGTPSNRVSAAGCSTAAAGGQLRFTSARNWFESSKTPTSFASAGAGNGGVGVAETPRGTTIAAAMAVATQAANGVGFGESEMLDARDPPRPGNISSEEHRSKMSRTKKALSFLRRDD